MNTQSLGNRMKRYEGITKNFLLPNSYSVIRIDGKCFSSYTRGLDKPFDKGLIEDMVETARFLCENIQGVHLAYTQSDEISLILSDLQSNESEVFFNGNVQKMASVSASFATAKFNQLRFIRKSKFEDGERGMGRTEVSDMQTLAFFDSRVFTLPSFAETLNYLRWRQRDAVKNSISMVAQSLYSHKELHKKNSSDKQEMIFQKGQNWNDYPDGEKRGSTVVKRMKDLISDDGDVYKRSVWEIEYPDFTKETAIEYLEDILPYND